MNNEIAATGRTRSHVPKGWIPLDLVADRYLGDFVNGQRGVIQPVGMQHVVEFSGSPPDWPAIRRELSDLGHVVQMRLIDGELCYPQDEPGGEWTELRVSIDKQIISLRRGSHTISVVTWGNADETMTRIWNRLAWATAKAGGGTIQTDKGPVSAAAFEAAGLL